MKGQCKILSKRLISKSPNQIGQITKRHKILNELGEKKLEPIGNGLKMEYCVNSEPGGWPARWVVPEFLLG